MSKAADIKEKQEAKERKEAIKAKISENIARQIYAEQAKVREKEDIVLELLQEEQKEAIEQKHKKDVEKQIRQRIETLHSLKTQMVEKAERKRQEAEEDAKYKEQMLAKLAEDNRVELLSDQKKRMKLLQLRRDVEQMIIDRRQQYAEERQLLMKLKEEEEYEMEQRKRIIEEERMRMLKEHIENLVGYIPKGLLRPDDLPQLGSDIFERCRPCQSFCME
ncbi:hypothetical protein NQ317_006406 [Molorchus minor]|uniref:Meiosis-specific nuclear structural protein 1 n=1 Tax=Molorchus minor TaxID=1323400 RepID=A0ABQ9JQ02_9CUCU|nr:hypothetical protein NQ317_006406 [Molorchus minor]